MQIPLYIYFIFFSLLVGLWHFRWLKNTFMIWFLPFLMITLITEIIGDLILLKSNGWLYNLYQLFEVLFFTFIYCQIPLQKIYKILFICLTTIFFSIVLAVHLIIRPSPLLELNVYLFVTAGFLIVLYNIFFLFYYFTLDNTGAEQKLIPLLYIGVGVTLYFSVLCIVITLYDYIRIHNLQIGGVKLYNALPRAVDYLLYSDFAYAFYLCRKINSK